jgi:hypothetical protein
MLAPKCSDSHFSTNLYQFSFKNLCTYERGVLVPPNLHELTPVTPPSMRDDLHSYLLPLLLQLFRILNVCLNRVFEEFILYIFYYSSNPYRVGDTLCRAARPQTLDNLVLTVLSKGKPSSLTSPALVTSIDHDVCDLVFH